MARCILWTIVILDSLVMLFDQFSGDNNVGLFPRIVTLSCLGVLALCESIEKINERR